MPGDRDIHAAELETLALYDPAADDASERLELIQYLVSLGATRDDLVAYREELPGLASVLALRGAIGLTLAEAAQRAGLPAETVGRINRVAGFPDPGPDDRVFGERVVGVVSGMAAAESIFGEEAVLQLLRVIGSAMARIADAVVSAFLVNVEQAARGSDQVGMSVARANAEAAALLPFVGETMDVLLRQHLIAARRTILGDDIDAGYETQRMAVGFVDLVGSTALAQRLSAREFGAMLTEFENLTADTITAAGGRVIKLIGDEVLYIAGDEPIACRIALVLTEQLANHPRVPRVRAGVAGGDVLLRDGDVFGPVVNLAARAVKLAGPGEVVAPPAVAAAAGLRAESLGSQSLKGFDEGIELCRLIDDHV
jgi:class 3 adenylate cyclase